MLLFENTKQKLLYYLKILGSPFKKFVSTGELIEELGVVQSRQKLLDSITDIIENNENFILPIIGEVGIGKTHLFWALKNKLYYYNTVYVSLENVYKKFYYNTYSEFIENLGVEPLRYIANQLCNDWGALERKYGFFHVADINKVRKTAFECWPTKFEDEDALKDVINAITAHQLDPYKKIDSERWLLGELMDIRELSRLNLVSDLRKERNSFLMLKILIENSKLGSVLYIDDFERILTMMKAAEEEIDETEEVFDPSWLYGTRDRSLPEIRTAKKILDKILNLQEIHGIRIIITLNSIESFDEIKKIIEEKNKKLLILFKDPLFLLSFDENDLFQFYKKTMEQFLEDINFLEVLKEYPDSYYPLNKSILTYIYNKSNGNPREIIKLLIKIFNEIISSYEDLDDILVNYE
ncbi:MAG: hypothetical protein ACFFA6_01785 [Promethearchaeota archaeon]